MQEKFKILFVIESLAATGGAEHALVNLLPALKKLGITCEVAALWGPYDLSLKLEEEGIKVHKFGLNYRWNLFRGTQKLVKLCRKNQYQIVHAHIFFAMFYTALSKFFVPGVKRVVTYHNLGYDSFPTTTLYKKLRKQADSFLNRYCMDGHVAVSNAVAMSYKKHLKLKSVTVIHNAVPIDRIVELGNKNKEIISKYNFADSDFLIVMPARLIREKGHKYMLEALKLLQDKGKYPKLLILGDGILKNDLLKKIRELKIENQVTIRSTVSHEELFPIIKRADVVVLSSTHEGFPLAPTEAMALHTPVIATEVGGLPDLIEDNISGLLIPPMKPEHLGNAIFRLMNEPELKIKLTEGGWKRLNEKFAVEETIKKWDEYYNSILR